MKDKLMDTRDTAVNYWKNLEKQQKWIFIGSAILIIGIISAMLIFFFNKKYVPLYNDLSVQEVSQIKEELEARNVPYEIKDNGTTIEVPEDQADALIVDLAGEGIPSSGHIDYSFFSENASWGITENEFNIMKLDAMQTELANLIAGLEGINQANVMINLPEESIFVSETEDEATASIVIHTDHGYQFEDNQIESLYHLVSKAIPNLPKENIIIRNQYLEFFDIGSSSTTASHDDYINQQSIKRDIEQDIQRRLQQMLGSIVGIENVIVSVTTDIDFTHENRIEELVDPVDLDNMEGLPVSVETIQESYIGDPDLGGVPGTGEEDIPNYPAAGEGAGGEYELTQETVNNEFNRVRKEIVESPYRIRDIGIQVAIDNVVSRDGEEIEYLTEADMNSVEEGISSILESMITTSINKDYGEIDPNEKISIIFQEFAGLHDIPSDTIATTGIPLYVYIIGAILLIGLIVFVILWIRRRRAAMDELLVEDYEETSEQEMEIPDLMDTEATEVDMQREQLERMARENPEEFTKLLRSWISDD